MTSDDTSHPALRPALAAAVASMCLFVSGRGQAQDAVAAVEVKELRAALSVAQEQAEGFRERAETAEAQRRALVESLAEAVRVSEEQMILARDTELKLQALGVDLIARDENALEQRLLKAVRDLDIAQQEIERRGAAVRGLSESLLTVLKSSDAVSQADRSRAESALAAANEALAGSASAESDTPDLADARIVSIDSAIGLVVLDAGRRTGLRVGTPVALLREDRPIFSALVVDVREGISGAVLQDRLGEAAEVEIGDGVRLLPEQNPL
jgi:hypothetical protein